MFAKVVEVAILAAVPTQYTEETAVDQVVEPVYPVEQVEEVQSFLSRQSEDQVKCVSSFLIAEVYVKINIMEGIVLNCILKSYNLFWLNYWHICAVQRCERFYVLYFIDTKTRSVNGLNCLQIS